MATTQTTTTPATPAKLRDGSWGARTRSEVHSGDALTITTRAGKTWGVMVLRVLSARNGVWLCETRSMDRAPRPRKSYVSRDCGGDYCGYACPVGGFRCSPKNGPCHDCE